MNRPVGVDLFAGAGGMSLGFEQAGFDVVAAVAPPIARAIASQIMVALGAEPTRPVERMALGDPALLEMTVSMAAQYWGIASPIQKRDRKSGAKKRSQLEVEAALEARESLADMIERGEWFVNVAKGRKP